MKLPKISPCILVALTVTCLSGCGTINPVVSSRLNTAAADFTAADKNVQNYQTDKLVVLKALAKDISLGALAAEPDQNVRAALLILNNLPTTSALPPSQAPVVFSLK
jgi:hypothetical protein